MTDSTPATAAERRSVHASIKAVLDEWIEQAQVQWVPNTDTWALMIVAEIVSNGHRITEAEDE